MQGCLFPFLRRPFQSSSPPRLPFVLAFPLPAFSTSGPERTITGGVNSVTTQPGRAWKKTPVVEEPCEFEMLHLVRAVLTLPSSSHLFSFGISCFLQPSCSFREGFLARGGGRLFCPRWREEGGNREWELWVQFPSGMRERTRRRRAMRKFPTSACYRHNHPRLNSGPCIGLCGVCTDDGNPPPIPPSFTNTL